jgi:MFS family permease
MQAGGSALVMANNFALVTALFPPEERGRAMGIAGGTISAMGYTLGPVLGGLLTHGFGWRSNFFVSATLAVAGFGAARFLLPPESLTGSTVKKEPFDLTGALTFALSISLLLFALMVLQKGAEQKSLVSLAALGGIVALGFFLWWEKRQSFPMLDLALFRISAFTLGNTARWISFIAMSVNNLLMPFFLQLVMGLDPLRAGLLVAPMPFAMALLAPVTGWMSERFVPERLCALGMTLTGVALVFLSFLAAGATAFEVVFGLAWLGLGMGLFQTPNNNFLMSAVPRHRLGIGSSVLSIVRSVGYSTGAALAAAIVSGRLVAVTGQSSLQVFGGQVGFESGSAVLVAFLQGYRYAYLTAAILCFIGAAVSAVRVSEK